MKLSCGEQLFFIFVVFILQVCDGAKILVVSPVLSRSHYIMGSELAKALAEAGHNVTIVSPYGEGFKPKNKSGSYREIKLGGYVDEVKERRNGNNMFEELWKWHTPLLAMQMFNSLGLDITELTLRNPDMQSLIKSDEKFDVILLEQFADEALKCLAPHFNAHLVIYNTIGSSFWTNEMTGNPVLPSYHPEVLSQLPPIMDFLQRLKNTLFTIALNLGHHLYYYPKHSELVRKYISEDLNMYDNLQSQSLVLINSHVSVSSAIPSVPQIVYIGGYHLKPAKKLPEDLQNFLDSANQGVILFSLGSVLRCKDMPVEKRNMFVRTFSKFNEKVVWKWDDDVLPGQPRNVRIAKWLPQSDILAHPNVKLFVTHCGYGSVTETVYHGKPVVALPAFSDQIFNGLNAEYRGLGININFEDITEHALTAAIKEVLENPKYTENAKRASTLFRDRQVKPLENAIYWIEYIVRHNGARHLRTSYLDMPWYQYYLIDVYACLLIIIIGPCLILPIIYRKRKLRQKNKSKKE